MLSELKINLKRVIDGTLTSRGLVEWCEELLEIEKLRGTSLLEKIEDIVWEWRYLVADTQNPNFELHQDVLESWIWDLSSEV